MSLVPQAAAVYCRISDDREGRSLGVARQEADCRELASSKGWPVAGVYVDNDISAADARKRRPEYERLLEDVKAGLVDAVVVWDLDRLHRRPLELERFFEVADAAGLRFLASVGGDVDLETGAGLMVARIKGAVAAEEVARVRQRVTRKHRELAEAGRDSGGSRPFGFEADRVSVREDEAVVIRELTERVLAGESVRSLCSELASRGVRTAQGHEWRQANLRRTLVRARNAGLREHHGEIVATAEWPAIITAETLTRLRAFFADPARKTVRTPRRYVLSGLVFCGRCGARMVARAREGGVRRYVCAKAPGLAGCGKVTVVAEPLEHLVVEAVLLRLDSPELAEALTGRSVASDAAELHVALAADEAQLDELAAAYGSNLMTLREFLAARKPIEARIESARKQLSRVSGTTALDGFVGHGDALRDVWETMGLARQRAVLAAVLDRLVVNGSTPGRNRFDPDRVDPIWKY